MSKGTYIITGAQMGAKINKRFWNGLNKIAEEKNATIHVLPLRGVSNHGRFIEVIKEEIQLLMSMIYEEDIKLKEFVTIRNNYKEQIKQLKKNKKREEAEELEGYELHNAEVDINVSSKEIANLEGKLQKREDELENLYPIEIREHIVGNNTILNFNTNICLNSIQISPTQRKPLTGLRSLVKKTTIFGSPKLALDVVPTSNNKLPRVMMATGAITEPFYSKSRVGAIADNDHIFSAILVEIVNDEEYHYRPLIGNGNGEVTDIGIRYSSNTKQEISTCVTMICTLNT